MGDFKLWNILLPEGRLIENIDWQLSILRKSDGLGNEDRNHQFSNL